MNIGNEIKNRRTELKLTQEDLAKKLNVSRTSVSNWEQKRNYPDIELLVTISDELDISLDKLLREDSKMVKEISLNYKKKKIFKGIILLLVLVIIGLIILCVNVWFSSPVSINPNDINIEKIEIIKTPEKNIDGKIIKEDNQYVLTVTSKALFNRFDEVVTASNNYTKDGKVFVGFQAKRSLNIFKNKKINRQSTLLKIEAFSSQVDMNDDQDSYNINKDIYITGESLDNSVLILSKDKNK